jgi:hypothetical protein
MRWILLCSALLIASCANIETARDLPRKEVSDVAIQGGSQKDPAIKKRIMILPFLDSNVQRDPEIAENARKALIDDLNRTGQLIAIDSKDLRIDASRMITRAGDYDMKEIGKQAAQLGVNSVLEGKILDLKIKRSSDQVGLIRNMTTKFESVLRVRVINSRGGRDLMNIIKTVEVDEPNTRVAERVETDRFVENNPELIKKIVEEAFLNFTPQVVASLDKVVWEGRIAAVSGDRIYLNVGRVSGLQVGDILKVTEEGKYVYDPETGYHIGKSRGRMKENLEVLS